MLGGDCLLDKNTAALRLDLRQLALKIRIKAVSQFSGALIFAPALRLNEFGAGRFKLLLELLLGAELVLFGMPPCGERRGFFLEVGQFALKLGQPLFRSRVGLFLQSLLLDFS